MQIAIILGLTAAADVAVVVVWLLARRQLAAEVAAGDEVVIHHADGSAERFVVPADVAERLAATARSAAAGPATA